MPVQRRRLVALDNAARYEIGIDGPLREYYVRDPLQASDDQNLVTEVGWPIFRSDH